MRTSLIRSGLLAARIAVALGMALLLVYLIMAALFESFIQPLTILLSVPFAFAIYYVGFTLLGRNVQAAPGAGDKDPLGLDQLLDFRELLVNLLAHGHGLLGLAPVVVLRDGKELKLKVQIEGRRRPPAQK